VIARTAAGLFLVVVPGAALLALADARLGALLVLGFLPLVVLLAVVGVTWSVGGRPA